MMSEAGQLGGATLQGRADAGVLDGVEVTNVTMNE
jgi:hypothetical protein